jgi:hypothetical protein
MVRVPILSRAPHKVGAPYPAVKCLAMKKKAGPAVGQRIVARENALLFSYDMSVHTSRQKPPWEVTSLRGKSKKASRRGIAGRVVVMGVRVDLSRGILSRHDQGRVCSLVKSGSGWRAVHTKKNVFLFFVNIFYIPPPSELTGWAPAGPGNKVSRPAKQSSPSSCCPSILLVRSRNSVFSSQEHDGDQQPQDKNYATAARRSQ